MRWLLVLMLTARIAHAEDDQRFVLAGLGSAMANQTAGWLFRLVNRIDIRKHGGGDEAHAVGGALVGFEVWGAGQRWGLSFPCGGYVGAQVGTVRTTIGAGIGMYAA